jgi:FixJ family two-component response regulator
MVSLPLLRYFCCKETVVVVGKILVIDDDDSMRTSIQRLLGAAGLTSVGYVSAEELLAGGVDHDVACLVSDMKLTGISGLELLAKLRAQGVESPFILITAYDTPGVREEASRRGAAYLTKPFLGSALLDAIGAAIEPATS